MNRQELRRENNNKFIKAQKIDCFENLPLVESSSDVKLKDINTVCKKMVATLISALMANSIISKESSYDELMKIFNPIIDNFGVKDCFNKKEIKLINGTYTQEDLVNLDWAFESYWVLCWAVGLIDDIKDASTLCDCNLAISFLFDSIEGYDSFKSKCHLRDIEEILDMIDLYYRYHWVVVEHSINPNANIGTLNTDNVFERRMALEWLVSEEKDWYDISLDT